VIDQILLAVSDGSQREWNLEEIEIITQDVTLQNQLVEWVENSQSDGCWHIRNYQILMGLIKPQKLNQILFLNEKMNIPF
jgi:c-di-GMP-related signal transduction protein